MYAFLLLLSLNLTWLGGVQTQCTLPRIRKSWYTLTQAEKDLYLDATELAMDRGFHAMFLEIHSSSRSDREAHHTCGFLLWHRRFILAYENMLRSLGRRYECLTIPYWDYFADYDKVRRGECSTLEACSVFLQEMGGSAGPDTTLTINNLSIRGNCVRNRPCNHFCETSRRTQCALCVPRGN